MAVVEKRKEMAEANAYSQVVDEGSLLAVPVDSCGSRAAPVDSCNVVAVVVADSCCDSFANRQLTNWDNHSRYVNGLALTDS